jgi:hypothetical protein
MKAEKYTDQYWEMLIQRYFEAETTEAEENELRSFLSTSPDLDSRYDEVRAVMGYLAMGRSLNKKKMARRPSRMIRTMRHVGVAASLALMIGFVSFYWSDLISERESYVAYVDGNKITDRAIVSQLMQESFAGVGIGEAESDAEAQLLEMFTIINE